MHYGNGDRLHVVLTRVTQYIKVFVCDQLLDHIGKHFFVSEGQCETHQLIGREFSVQHVSIDEIIDLQANKFLTSLVIVSVVIKRHDRVFDKRSHFLADCVRIIAIHDRQLGDQAQIEREIAFN